MIQTSAGGGEGAVTGAAESSCEGKSQTWVWKERRTGSGPDRPMVDIQAVRHATAEVRSEMKLPGESGVSCLSIPDTWWVSGWWGYAILVLYVHLCMGSSQGSYTLFLSMACLISSWLWFSRYDFDIPHMPLHSQLTPIHPFLLPGINHLSVHDVWVVSADSAVYRSIQGLQSSSSLKVESPRSRHSQKNIALYNLDSFTIGHSLISAADFGIRPWLDL